MPTTLSATDKIPFVRIVDGKKLCPRCRLVLPLDSFHKDNSILSRHAVKTYCKKCASERVILYRKGLPDGVQKRRQKQANLKTKFNLTIASLLEMFRGQDSKCGICRDVLDFVTYGKAWVVDHDHSGHPKTRHPKNVKPRGLLCYRCNTALGNFRDSPMILQSAIAYLDAAQKNAN